MNRIFSGVVAVLLLVSSTLLAAEEKWRVHEWGTFTSLQDETGAAIGGINTDDEPVPHFVHRLANFLLLQPTEVPPVFFQGAPRCHPDVTMRLETPVIYFHPPKSQKGIQKADVKVRFRGGWLTEFFPDATPDAPGLHFGEFRFGRLRSNTESRLEWTGLKIGGDWPLTNTTEHVWLSPRAVQADLVQTEQGETEKFLFYRGVAHINAPLRISREQFTQLVFRSQWENPPNGESLTIPAIWLVEIRPDGKLAFRTLPSVALDRDADKILTRTPASFDPSDFRTENVEELKRSLHQALLSEGLFADEAQALLNTWELSYFKSAGLRVFFVVPRAWTDFYLPLKVSIPAEVKRVMIGRIELVMPGQREGLREIARLTSAEIIKAAEQLRNDFYANLAGGSQWEQVRTGQKPLSAGISVPKSYQTYLDLGRFRNALILDQAKRRPTEGLTTFISKHALHAYEPVEN